LPCGILDQGTSAFGETNQIVQIDCAEESFSTLALPPQTSFWIFDTGIKHDLVDSLYGTRNQECMDALALLQKNDPTLECLAKCSPSLLQKTSMPENLLKRSRHVVEEQDRVLRFGEGLKNGTPPRELGLLLNASHQSSSKLFENSLPELDFMVSQLIGNDKVLGARLTGGGFGGAVLAWTTLSFSEEDASLVAEKYDSKWSSTPHFHSFLPSSGARSRDPLEKDISH
jgi:galactokinase